MGPALHVPGRHLKTQSGQAESKRPKSRVVRAFWSPGLKPAIFWSPFQHPGRHLKTQSGQADLKRSKRGVVRGLCGRFGAQGPNQQYFEAHFRLRGVMSNKVPIEGDRIALLEERSQSMCRASSSMCSELAKLPHSIAGRSPPHVGSTCTGNLYVAFAQHPWPTTGFR